MNRIGAMACGLLLLAPTAASPDDIVVQPSTGDAFVVKDSAGATERLRVDEATGDVSRNGLLFLHTRGNASTFVGTNSGASNTGFANVSLGSSAMADITTGTQNTAVGVTSLGNNTTGSNNSAVGVGALQANVAGSNNAAFGLSALLNNTASNNTAVGALALLANTTGSQNVAVGLQALDANTTGNWSVAVGSQALSANTTSVYNVAVGKSALALCTTSGNVAVGGLALSQMSGGLQGSNTAVGFNALGTLPSGDDNIAIGNVAGYDLVQGSNNIYLGNRGNSFAPGQSITEWDTIRIGDPTRHDETYIAGIQGTTVSGSAVHVAFGGKLGVLTSSRRYKRDIEPLDPDAARVQRLRPVSFRYRDEVVGAGNASLEYGLIAEEVADVAPELVVLGDDGRPQSVRYHLLTPLLLAELQRQQAVIEEQGRSVGQLATEVAELRARLAELVADESERRRARPPGGNAAGPTR